jgi:alginate O-acetyltransferase complex protein AlgI
VSAYLPRDAAAVERLAGVLGATLLLGYAITRLRPGRITRTLAWALVVGAGFSAERLSGDELAGVRMLVLIAALFWALKAVVGVEAQAEGQPALTATQWFAFVLGWPGMRPNLFARLGGPALGGARQLVVKGLARMAAGVPLLLLAWWLGTNSPWLATPPLLVGISLVVHFGLFDVAAGLWRLAGVDTRPLFRAPLRATSLAQFWGRRWNLAFSEMTALAVYRPLHNVIGKRMATAAAFGFSGLLHELAISVPVRAGYGLPMLYFLLQGTLVLVERALERAGRPIQRLGLAAHVWVLGWLAVPLPILFHPPFLRGVLWPLIGVE